MQESYFVIISVGTMIAALGFGWFVVAPFYKWAIRRRFKDQLREKGQIYLDNGHAHK